MLLEGLKITATDGTAEWVPSNFLKSIKTAAPTGNSPWKTGKVTAYTLGAGSEVVVAAYNGANTLVEFGGYTNDGLFVAAMSNRTI